MGSSKITELSVSKADEYPFHPGSLDKTLAIFERHGHPFIVVGTLAGKWSSTNGMTMGEIDLLMKPSAVEGIVHDLVAEDWEVCQNPFLHSTHVGGHTNTTEIQDMWLAHRQEGPFHPVGLKYLRLWPETLYQLSTDCRKIEIPDIFPARMVTFEEEYYRDPLERFGPCRLSYLESHSEQVLQPPRNRVRYESRVPMFIPIIEDHINALIDQAREEKATKKYCGNFPLFHINNFIRYHIWDWPAASAWLLATKIRARNYELMKHELDRYIRKPLAIVHPIRGICPTWYPWEADPPPAWEPLKDPDNESTPHSRLMASALLREGLRTTTYTK